MLLTTDVFAITRQLVRVPNYRCRPTVWEPGTIVRVETQWYDRRGVTSYRVRLERTDRENLPLYVTVGRPGIKLLEKERQQ